MRGTHWVGAASFFVLIVSGVIILMCHPRLYWGEAGNDLTPAWLELPISRNFQHGGWTNRTPFFPEAPSPATASRTFEIFNQNGWGRSLHFLGAWVLVATGTVYLLAGLVTRHFQRHLIPPAGELTLGRFRQEILSHLRLQIRPGTGGPQYGLLQKLTYCGVLFGALPLAVVTGLGMSPAVTAVFPLLSGMFGGHQSARTLHFFASVVLVLFLGVHLAMVIQSGFRRQIRALTLGD